MTANRDNVVLIGMPGVGKSTVGVLLAKRTSRDFLDTDVVLQARARCTLQDLLQRDGAAAFRQLEQEALLALRCENTVIATGGSAVYGERAMLHLRSLGTVVHLFLPLDAVRERVGDLLVRGVVREPGQSLESLFTERLPLYQRYADVTIDCGGVTHEEVIKKIVSAVPRPRGACP
jgi:shikimate kinase